MTPPALIPAFRDMWTPDPVVPRPSDAQIAAIVQKEGSRAPQVLREMEKRRKELIAGRDIEAFKYGYVPPVWKRAEDLLWQSKFLVVYGANRSTKTTFFIWAAVRHAVREQRANILFLHNDDAQSIAVHQRMFAHYLPSAWKPDTGKRSKKGDTNLSYHPRTGFANGNAILGNGARITFGNYQQDFTRFEGEGYTLILLSEKCPLALMETLSFRIPGAPLTLTMGWDYTPIEGLTPAISSVITGAQCVDSERAIHLPENHRAERNQDWPVGHMPRLQKGVRAGLNIIYFWSEDNILGGGHELRKKMEEERWDTTVIEKRMYGYARNVTGKALPKFSKANIVQRAQLEKMGLLGAATCKRFLYDPAGARNPFMAWFSADENGRHCAYREWPDRPRHGEWAVRSTKETKWNGDRGPAQDKLGLSVAEQKAIILESEGWVLTDAGWTEGPGGVEEIHERYIDPRAGNAARQAANEGDAETIIDIFAEEQIDARGVVIGPAMHFIPAPGISEDSGIETMNTKYLAYDTTREIVPLINEPLFYVAEECEQIIYSALNYRPGRGAKDEACKDPFDVCRYYFTADPEYAEPGGKAFHRGRGFTK